MNALLRLMSAVMFGLGMAILAFGWVPPSLHHQPHGVVSLAAGIFLIGSLLFSLQADVRDLERKERGSWRH